MTAAELDALRPSEDVAPPPVLVRGYGFLGMFRYIKGCNFPCGVQGLLQYGDRDLQARFQERIDTNKWYPYDQFLDLIALMEKVLGKNDPEFLRKLGRQAASADSTGIYRFLTILSSPGSIVRVAIKAWRRFCNQGEFELLYCDDGRFDISLRNLPGIDPRHCKVFLGWLEGMAYACGAKSAWAEQLSCAGQSDDHCLFRCTFKM